MSRTYAFAALEAEYARRWADMVVQPQRVAAIDAMARRIIAGKGRYRKVEALTGVPWAFIGVLHSRESSCDFHGVLHNGEKIIGTGRRTRLVPEGRGPFATWEEAAVDALAIKGYAPGFPWSLPRCLFEGERFNGFGYRMHGVPSAYLWSFSNQYVRGKYVKDGVWSATTVDQQMGIAPLMRRLMALNADVAFGAQADDEPQLSPLALTPAAIDPGDGLDPGEIRALQQRLRDLGYAEVGKADGLWGPRTTAGVAAFQATASLPVTGALDTPTAAALATAAPRPVSAERAGVTARALQAQGDVVAKAAGTVKNIAATGAVSTAVIGVLDQLGTATDKLAVLRELLGHVPGPVWVSLVVGVALSLYLIARRGEAAKVEAVRSGRDAGPA